jgi:hypothetical protein
MLLSLVPASWSAFWISSTKEVALSIAPAVAPLSQLVNEKLEAAVCST